VTIRLGLIGYGAIGKHVEAALKSGGIENLELVAALVKRPRHDQRPGGLLTHEPDRFFATPSTPSPNAPGTRRCGFTAKGCWNAVRTFS